MSSIQHNSIEADAILTELRDTIAQQAELLAAHKAEMQDWQRALLAAQQESAGYKKDAERYRWLREDSVTVDDVFFTGSHEVLDAAIDAALAKHTEDEIEQARRMV